MKEYAELVGTMTTSALVHLIETRGTVSPEHKDVIADELTARGVAFNRPDRPGVNSAPRCPGGTPWGRGHWSCVYCYGERAVPERPVRDGHTWPCPRFWDDANDDPRLVRRCTCRQGHPQTDNGRT